MHTWASVSALSEHTTQVFDSQVSVVTAHGAQVRVALQLSITVPHSAPALVHTSASVNALSVHIWHMLSMQVSVATGQVPQPRSKPQLSKATPHSKLFNVHSLNRSSGIQS